MAIIGFNVGATQSMRDISLAVDYLLDKESFEPELRNIQENIFNKKASEVYKIK